MSARLEAMLGSVKILYCVIKEGTYGYRQPTKAMRAGLRAGALWC